MLKKIKYGLKMMLISSDSINALKRIDCLAKCVDIIENWCIF